MGRPGIEQGKIREVIDELDAEGKAISVTSIRERLGSGSYSTLGAVLAAWRKERAEAVPPTVPAIPEGVTRLVGHLWAEAWKAADSEAVNQIKDSHRNEAAAVPLDSLKVVNFTWVAAILDRYAPSERMTKNSQPLSEAGRLQAAPSSQRPGPVRPGEHPLGRSRRQGVPGDGLGQPCRPWPMAQSSKHCETCVASSRLRWPRSSGIRTKGSPSAPWRRAFWPTTPATSHLFWPLC